jgi:hypothetical protein
MIVLTNRASETLHDAPGPRTEIVHDTALPVAKCMCNESFLVRLQLVINRGSPSSRSRYMRRSDRNL